MTKLLSLTLLTAFFLIGCSNTNTSVPTTASKPTSSLENYTNNTYHFSLQYPKKISSVNCKMDGDVKAIESKNAIEIGAKFNCPEEAPSSLRGFEIYAANNINKQEDVQIFLDQTFGKGCQVTEWKNGNASLTENQSNAFFIESLNRTDENPFGDCKFAEASKHRTFYSPRLKTIVFWDLTQEPQFVYKDTIYDEDVLNSFKFTN